MKPPARNITCLIIDDEAEACDRLEQLLQKVFNVEVAGKETDAEKGITEAVLLFPDIVFLDVEMPGKNGFEVIKSIHAKNVFPTFIFVTGYNQYAIKAIRNAAFDYLLKPVDIGELREAVERFRTAQAEKLTTALPAKLKSRFSLTDREIEIIRLLREGKTSKQIGEILFISRNTVDTHRRNILQKTNTGSTAALFSLLDSLR